MAIFGKSAPMKLTHQKILDAITFVEGNELMGAGKMSKKEHLADLLLAMFNQAEPSEIKVAAPLLADTSTLELDRTREAA